MSIVYMLYLLHCAKPGALMFSLSTAPKITSFRIRQLCFEKCQVQLKVKWNGFIERHAVYSEPYWRSWGWASQWLVFSFNSDQHSNVMSVASHYGGIMAEGHQITLDGHHHNQANNTQCHTGCHSALQSRVDLLRIHIAFVHSWIHIAFVHITFVQSPTHITCVLIFDRRSHFHRAHYLSKCAHDTGSGMRAFCDALCLRFLAAKHWLAAKYWMPNTGCQILDEP